MLHSLQSQVVPLLAERLTLVINHVLNAETTATEKLRPHAGRTLALEVTAWPSVLPQPPVLAWRISRAGLLEWCSAETMPLPPDLNVRLEASNPAAVLLRALSGQAPPVQIEGDAQLAADVNWLLQNLRWDVAADLERLFGPVVAQQLYTIGRAVARALRSAVALAARGASTLGARARSDGG